MRNVFIFLFILFFHNTLYCENLIEYDYEADVYYSNISAFIDLDSVNEITDASTLSEFELYENLILNTFSPNIFLAEIAVHPMPIFGLYFRKNHNELYDNAHVEDFNLVKTFTAGFEEPYSFSLFFGRMIIFKNKEKQRSGKNRAYIGYLLSVGDYSIKDNLAHYNKWINFEFKLKGTREKEDKDLDWSFRIGAKINNNPNFVDTYYVGARRSSIDYKKTPWTIRYNSAFSSMLEVSSKTFKLTAAEMMIEKKFPLSWSDKVALGIGIGYLFNSGARYKGKLKEDGIDNHQIIFRPNIKF